MTRRTAADVEHMALGAVLALALVAAAHAPALYVVEAIRRGAPAALVVEDAWALTVVAGTLTAGAVGALAAWGQAAGDSREADFEEVSK